jgi:hypothetical protein
MGLIDYDLGILHSVRRFACVGLDQNSGCPTYPSKYGILRFEGLSHPKTTKLSPSVGMVVRLDQSNM